MVLVTCGRCRKDSGTEVKHSSPAEVRACYEAPQSRYLDFLDGEYEAEARAEYEAEMAAERWYENRGADEAYAERQWEDSRGVIQFSDAMRLAEAGA